MALICLYRSNVPAGNTTELLKNSRGEFTTNADNTKEVVEIAKHHPATFAYAVKDEPFSHMTPTMYADLENSYKIIRDLDDVHPGYNTCSGPYQDCGRSGERTKAGICDFAGILLWGYG